jgi:hypothetical protein
MTSAQLGALSMLAGCHRRLVKISTSRLMTCLREQQGLVMPSDNSGNAFRAALAADNKPDLNLALLIRHRGALMSFSSQQGHNAYMAPRVAGYDTEEVTSACRSIMPIC